MFRLDGKVALVVGCGASGEGLGNGQAITITLARQGAKVVGLDLNLEAAERTAEQIRAEGHGIDVFAANATKAADIEAAVARCLELHGRIDILVNNVGQSEPGDPVTMAEETWHQQISLNLDTAFLGCKAVIPVMEKQGGGAIVSISSVAGMRYVGKPQVGYAAAKSALMQMTRTTAVIYAEKGIRLNCVVPGLVFTPLVKRLADKYAGGEYEAFVNKRHQQVPMKRMGDAWDVANAVAFLTSDEAGYITGQSLVVDGGLTSTTP